MCTRKDECPDLPTNSQYGDGEAAARRSARKPAVDWQSASPAGTALPRSTRGDAGGPLRRATLPG